MKRWYCPDCGLKYDTATAECNHECSVELRPDTDESPAEEWDRDKWRRCSEEWERQWNDAMEENEHIRRALLTASEDLYKAANQFAAMRDSQEVGYNAPVVRNPEIFEEKAARAREALDQGETGICGKAPEGWSCSRPAGHDGPCAATPVCTCRVGRFTTRFDRDCHYHGDNGGMVAIVRLPSRKKR